MKTINPTTTKVTTTRVNCHSCYYHRPPILPTWHLRHDGGGGVLHQVLHGAMQGALAGVRGLAPAHGDRDGLRVQHGSEVGQASVPEDGEAAQTLNLLPAVEAFAQAGGHVGEGVPVEADGEVTAVWYRDYMRVVPRMRPSGWGYGGMQHDNQREYILQD
jgi:hypothetical protein